MLKADVVNWEGKKVSEIMLPEEIFGRALDKPLLHRVVCWQLARRRRGTHSVKTRAEVRGGGRKPFRQKGTGNARQGSIRSPLLRGGGVIHGPKPRNYGEALPQKIRTKALAHALSYIFQEKRLALVENMQSKDGKTKELALRLVRTGWKKALLVDAPLEEKFQRAVRNIQGFKLIPPEGVNVYDILKFDRMALTVRAFQALSEKRFQKEISKGKGSSSNPAADKPPSFQKEISKGKGSSSNPAADKPPSFQKEISKGKRIVSDAK